MAARTSIITVRSSRRAQGEFWIEGTLEDGTAVAADFTHGVLYCPAALRERAEALVASGEVFELPGTSRRYMATLDGEPVAIALTLIRAMRVDTFEIMLDGATITRRPHPAAPTRLPL